MQRGEAAASRLWPIAALLTCGCSGGTTMVGDGGEDAGIQDPGENVRIDDAHDPGADEEPEAGPVSSVAVATAAVPRDTACLAVDAYNSQAGTAAEVHTQCGD